MNTKDFTVGDVIHYFIGTGAKTGYYTLRYQYLGTNSEGERVVKETYFCNLSTDKELAVQKAIAIANKQGKPFVGDADFRLEDIRRRKHEEIQAQRDREQAQRDAAAKAWDDERAAMVISATFISGKYSGYKVDDVAAEDQQYLTWLADQYDPELCGRFNVNCEIAYKYLQGHKLRELRLIGQVGDKLELTLRLKFSFMTNGQFPTPAFVCLTEEGDNVFFTTSSKTFWEWREGDKAVVTGTVRSHDEERKSTRLERVKLIREIKE